MKLTFLGTGTSFGVPKVGCYCDVCRSPDPRDKRNRVGAVVESNRGTRLLIDTPPELRLQLIAAGIDRVDAVAFTHEHADHTHGIDDLRAITVNREAPLPIYGSKQTLDDLAKKFRYIFDDAMRPLPGTSKPEGKAHVIKAGDAFSIADLDITAVGVPHGNVTVFAYRIGPLAYVTDAKSIPPDAIELLRGASVLVINALFRTEHPTHLSFPEAIEAAREIGAERTYLTHLTHDNFHADLEAELPRGIAPAFDGLTVRID
ncbi:MAG TPA: MBL fold metallo-hydrolase [Gemmatimonadaceae bacterium]|jgi:phosphoribosyl 1,2-cyclic phosphate phosphodiesterase|nr:MBL fold metallo-hydrolase [Gemmatimonadaceae bacterium]